MNLSQARWVVGTIVVSESAWLFALLGLLGAIIGLDESPLGWLAILALLGMPVLVMRLGPSEVKSVELFYLAHLTIAAVAVYIAVGTQVGPGTSGLDLAWGIRLVSGGQTDAYVLKALAGAIIGALLWWRGTWIGLSLVPASTLAFSFRIGIFVIAFAALMDIVYPGDLNTFSMIFIFFAAGLAGLSISHLMQESAVSSSTRTWPRIIAGTVSAMVLLGLAISLSHKGIQSLLSAPLGALGGVAQGAFWIVVAPIALAVSAFSNLVLGIFDRPFEPNDSPAFNQGQGDGGGTSQELDIDQFREAFETSAQVLEEGSENGAESLAILMQILQSLFVLAVAAVIVYLIVKTLQRLLVTGRRGTRGDPDSIKDDASVMSDLAKLLLGLRPNWLKGRRRKAGLWVPDGPPGIVNVLRVYYDLLSKAENRGFTRHLFKTPIELQPDLEQLLPQRLVRVVTSAFNRAYYGNIPSSPEQITEMRSFISMLPRASAGDGERAP